MCIIVDGSVAVLIVLIDDNQFDSSDNSGKYSRLFSIDFSYITTRISLK